MAYADPDAVTQIANGLSTTTFTYDNNGNVTQKTVDGTTTTYVYDYANRLTALGAGGATTTYGYDWAGNRVLQTGTTTTYLYPFRWYSVASSTGTGAKYATMTDYVFNGDTLLATADQQTASGAATGTAKTRYVHPDHLGSTNIVTDENGNVVQTLPRCAICRNIHPTSTRSNCLTANSRRTCASLPHAPSPASTAPSARSCTSSSRGNAPIITNMQAMLPYDRNPL